MSHSGICREIVAVFNDVQKDTSNRLAMYFLSFTAAIIVSRKFDSSWQNHNIWNWCQMEKRKSERRWETATCKIAENIIHAVSWMKQTPFTK